MKRIYLFAIAAVALVGCSSNDLVDDTSGNQRTAEVPIEFNVQKQNITRAANLETVKHYNFGVFAWKVNGKNSLADAEVMNNYLVGWSDNASKGYYYDPAKTSTWAATPDADPTTDPTAAKDHKSPWFYEGLGTSEYTYTGTDGFYTTSDGDYMSNNANQWLRYWDLAYEKTNFYCYAPYNKDVTFTKDAATSTLNFGTGIIRDGYDEPLNSNYANYSRTLGEFMYAGVQATNSALADVTIPFKHMGAQLFIRFYEDIPGYKVEIIDLAADQATDPTADKMKGIQATPAIKPTSGTDYTLGTYYTTQGATLNFNEADAVATYTPTWTEGSETSQTSNTTLMFKIPQAGLSTAATAPANLTAFAASKGNTTSHNVIQEAATSGAQTYSYSPTIYYPVAQPITGNTTGFTFHISYRVIAEDNGEVITVHNATVHVPYSGNATVTDVDNEDNDETTKLIDKTGQLITVWQPNVKYTYTFKFTRKTTGTTNPDTPINPDDPTPSTVDALYPIVFDFATIDDYTENFSEHIIQGTTAE